MTNYIYSYRQGSRSAIALGQQLGFARIRHENSRFRGNERKTVINWGATALPEQVLRCRVLNSPENLRRASNKRMFFEHLAALPEAQRPRVPEWTLDLEVARGWFSEEGRNTRAVVRTVLAGHSGEGIIMANSVDDLRTVAQGTLITKYVPKESEFRLHVARGGNVFCIQQKRRRTDVSDDQVNWQVRNLAGGFIFARENVELPDDVRLQAQRALAAVDLDFGAVDVIFNRRRNEAYVLEINSAPGLEGSTLSDYEAMFREVLNVRV